MDALAALTAHIPPKRQQVVRYCGYYSNKARGQRRLQQPRAAGITPAAVPAPEPEPDDFRRHCKRAWARLIRKVWAANPSSALIFLVSLAEANLLVFEHRCGSSISILASRLRHIVPAPRDEAKIPRLYGTDMCREHCTRLEDLAACDRPCVNATDRRLVQLLLEMKRSRASQT